MRSFYHPPCFFYHDGLHSLRNLLVIASVRCFLTVTRQVTGAHMSRVCLTAVVTPGHQSLDSPASAPTTVQRPSEPEASVEPLLLPFWEFRFLGLINYLFLHISNSQTVTGGLPSLPSYKAIPQPHSIIVIIVNIIACSICPIYGSILIENIKHTL